MRKLIALFLLMVCALAAQTTVTIDASQVGWGRATSTAAISTTATATSWTTTGTYTSLAYLKGGTVGAGNYAKDTVVLMFDTSVIPDDATITGASLKLTADSTWGSGSTTITMGWYSGAFDATAYTAAAQGSAMASTAFGSWNYLSTVLLNPAANISKTGTTGLRIVTSNMALSTDGTGWYQRFRMAASYNQLVVTYTLPNAGAVTINPTSPVTLYQGQSQQYSATVSGGGSVNWSLSPNVGSIDSGGMYLAPSTLASDQTVTITATNAADSSKSASVTVDLKALKIVISSATLFRIVQGETAQLAASVTDSPGSTEVTWEASGGSIDSNGLFTAPASVSGHMQVSITARGVADTSKTATATVHVDSDRSTFTLQSGTDFGRNTGGTWNAGGSLYLADGVNLYMRFNTASIPDDAVISQATLSMYADGVLTSSNAACQFGFGWLHVAGMLNATAVPYTSTAQTSAFGPTQALPYNGKVAGNLIANFQLQNLANLNLAGYTGLLMNFASGASSCYLGATNSPMPVLTVLYSAAAPVKSRLIFISEQ